MAKTNEKAPPCVCDTDVPGWELTIDLLPGEGGDGDERAVVTFGPGPGGPLRYGPPPACPVVLETASAEDVSLIKSILTDEETGDEITEGEVGTLLDWLADRDPLARDLLDRLRSRSAS